MIFFSGFIFWFRFLVVYFFGHRNPGSVEWCNESEEFFPKNVKKVEKTRKNTKKGGPKKRSFFDPFVPGAIFGKKHEKHATNSPPSGTFSIFFVRPRSCFYTVPVLVVGGVQSGGNFFCSFLKTFFRVCTFVFAILGVDIIPGGGGLPRFPGFRTAESGNYLVKRRRIWIYDSSYNRWLRLTLDFRSRPFIGHVNIFGPLIGAATHERHSVDNRLDSDYFVDRFCSYYKRALFSSRNP